MFEREILRQQLMVDLDRLHDMILRYMAGDRSVKQERDQLGGAVQVKLAFLREVAGFPG